MRKVRGLLIGYAVIALLTGWPLVLGTIAGVTAWLNGCTLNEAAAHPCVVGGRDIGATLYTMGVMLWFLIPLIPLGLLATIVWTTAWLIWRVVQKRKSAAGATIP